MSKLGDRPAFPVTENDYSPHELEQTTGVSIRQLYAGMAMQGMLSNSELQGGKTFPESHGNYARDAVKLADALINALESETE